MMTDKKHNQPSEEPLEADDSSEAEAREAAADPQLEALQDQLAEARVTAAENLDGWQRALAEFQNFKKRVERDRATDQEAMRADLIRRVLPVLDDLERALENRLRDDPWADGIELIRRKLQSILEAEGVRRIDAEGAVFDPNLHDAISQEPVDGTESGRVIGITLNGYMLGDRVIRPAQVRVAA